MQINVTGHHVEVTPALRAYVTEKLQRISRHFDHVISINVILKVENQQQHAEATVHAAGKSIFAQDANDDMYAAIDGLSTNWISRSGDTKTACAVTMPAARKGRLHWLFSCRANLNS